MARISQLFDLAVNWLARNVRSFGYLLPDSLELALYVCLVMYFVAQFGQQQA